MLYGTMGDEKESKGRGTGEVGKVWEESGGERGEGGFCWLGIEVEL